jgi:hypothetical protein
MAGVWQGCNDDSYKIGLELLPAQDSLDVRQNALMVETYTIGPVGIPVYDSLNLPFGVYNDQVFGQTKAGLILEFSPANNYIRINEGVVVDTVIMDIYYDTIYEDQSYIPQIEVFELTDGLDKSARYYSDFDLNGKYNPDNLAISLTEKPDTINRLSLLLNHSLGESILDIPEMNDSAVFASYKIDSVFDVRFRGLYLNPVDMESDGGLMNIRSVLFTVSFHTNTDTASISFAFLPRDTRYLTVDGQIVPMGDRSIKIFDHDYSASEIAHLNDSNVHDTFIYLESLGGTQAILEIPALEQLRASVGRVSVNSAKLVIPAYGDSAELVNIQLGMRILDEEDPYLPDDLLYQASQYVPVISFMNGRFDSSDQGYQFNMTAYFHEYMKGNINSSRLRIFLGRLDTNLGRTNFNPINYKRLVLSGSSNVSRKITLKLTYTII